MNLALVLTWSRVLLTVVLYPLAYFRMREAFLLMYITATLTDVIDGQVARQRRETTEAGARLDTWADQFLLVSAAYWMYVFEPAFIDWLLVPGIFVAWIIVNNIVCWFTHGRLANFHLWSAKIATALLMVMIGWWIWFGITGWIYWMAMFATFVAVMETSLVVLLGEPRTNMKSYFSAFRNERR